MTEEFEKCLLCGMYKNNRIHDSKNPPITGWHPFRGKTYLYALEDALLFAREHNSHHQWEETGAMISTSPEFIKKRCSVCGAINWGGKEDGVCFGNQFAESAIANAHNRSAFKKNKKRKP